MANITQRELSRSPFRMLREFERQMEEMFEDFTSGGKLLARESEFAPVCDVDETDSHYLVSFDVPGVKKDNISIEVANNVLTISGERQRETREGEQGRLRERSYGRFLRSFTLPAGVEGEKVEANYEDGVLTVAVPKTEATRPRKIEIKEGRGGLFSKLVGGGKAETEQKH